jgi:hypothetical protein
MKLIKDRKAAAGMLMAIILVISVMFAAIVGAVIFFAFGQSAYTAQEHNESFSATHTTNATLAVTYIPASASITVWAYTYNATSTNWTLVSSANWDQDGRVITVDTSGYDANLSQLAVNYQDMGYTTTTSVITYAVIVFAMVALVPLIIIGGVMLKSLGFFSGGGNV